MLVGQHLGHPARQRRRRGPGRAGRPALLGPAARAGCGWWSCGTGRFGGRRRSAEPALAGRRPRDGRPPPRRRPGRAAPARLRAACRRAARSGCGWPPSSFPSRCSLPGPLRAAHPLLLRPPAVADLQLPDGLRRGARQRRDAQRGPAVQRRGDHPAGLPRGRDRPVRPALRGVVSRTARAPGGRVVPGAAHHRRPDQRGPSGRPPGHRRRHHGGAGAGDGHRPGRRGPSR